MGWVNKNSGTKRYQQGGPIATNVAPVQKYGGGGGPIKVEKKDLTVGDVYKAGKRAVGKVKKKVKEKIANIKVKDIAKVAGAITAPKTAVAMKLSAVAYKKMLKKLKSKGFAKKKRLAEYATDSGHLTEKEIKAVNK